MASCVASMQITAPSSLLQAPLSAATSSKSASLLPQTRTLSRNLVSTSRHAQKRTSASCLRASLHESELETSTSEPVIEVLPPLESSLPSAPATSSSNDLLSRATGFFAEAFRKLHKPLIVGLLLAAMVALSPDIASAAQSGGRVGGRVSSGGSSGYSRSYSAPRYSAPSYSAPTVIAPSFSAPYYAPSPFFWGGGFNPFFWSSPTVVVGGGGGGFLFNLLFGGIVAFFLINLFTNFVTGGGMIGSGTKTSVVRLQVGLLGLAKNLQLELDRMADRADTSTAEGLHYVLTETVLSLLRHPDYWVRGYSSSEVKNAAEDGEAVFNQLSLEERGKFEQETLINVGAIRRKMQKPRLEERFTSEYIVVTILVALEGDMKLPSVNNSGDMQQALRKLGSIPVDQVQAVEILWTPQDAGDTLSERELLTDYPQLRSL